MSRDCGRQHNFESLPMYITTGYYMKRVKLYQVVCHSVVLRCWYVSVSRHLPFSVADANYLDSHWLMFPLCVRLLLSLHCVVLAGVTQFLHLSWNAVLHSTYTKEIHILWSTFGVARVLRVNLTAKAYSLLYYYNAGIYSSIYSSRYIVLYIVFYIPVIMSVTPTTHCIED